MEPLSSKMGWPFYWPEDEPWPVCQSPCLETLDQFKAVLERVPRDDFVRFEQTKGGCRSSLEIAMPSVERCGAPYVPILQLNRTSCPQLAFPADIHMLQVLWCPTVHFEGHGGFLLIWRVVETIVKLRREAPPLYADESSIAPCILDPEVFNDYPDRAEIQPPWESGGLEENWWEASQELGAAPGTKVFGFPHWIQNPEYPACRVCNRQMKLFITISSAELGHGGLNSVRWIPYEDREILKTAPFAIRERYELPHDWMIGDGGNAYLFYCQECGQFDSIVQSG